MTTNANVQLFLAHQYSLVQAASYKEAVDAFFRRHHYAPAPVFGPVGCGDALESRYVPKGFYYCALRVDAPPPEEGPPC